MSDPSSLTAASDEELMSLVQQGHAQAFQVLMQRHLPRMIRYARGQLSSLDDAEDVAQEVFLRVWSRAQAYDSEKGLFLPWLYRVAGNLAIDRLRRPTSLDLEHAAEVADPQPSAVQLIEDRQRREHLSEAIEALPERQRQAIALFHFAGVSGREGASAMNVTETAFESLLNRARSALKNGIRRAQKCEE